MPRSVPRAVSAVAVVLALLAASVITGNTASAENSDQVRARLAKVVAEADAAEARVAELETRIAKVEKRLAKVERSLEATGSAIGARSRALYMSGAGGFGVVASMMSSDKDTVLSKLGYLEVVARNDEQLLREGTALRRSLRQDRVELDQLRADAVRTATQLTERRAELMKLLDKLAAQEQAAAERSRIAAERARAARLEAIRRARASRARVAPVLSGTFACLVGPARAYSDTFGAPRSGGRRHQGVDVFAPYGSPVYAVESGVVVESGSNGLGGIVIWLQGDSGTAYYYAHNSANLVRTGERVAVGEQIGRVGTSGNAQGTPPHVHFEVHPGGRRVAAINPTPFVRRVCP